MAKRIEAYSAKRIEFVDARGSLQILRPCSITDREYLADALQSLYQLVQEADDSLTFEQLLDESPIALGYCKEAIARAGLKWHKLSLELIQKLLLPSEQSAIGFIAEVNFGEAKAKEIGIELEPENVEAESAKAYNELIATIWAATDSLIEALQLAKEVPADALLDIIQARAKQLEDARREAEYANKPNEKLKHKAKAELLAKLESGEL